MREIAPSALRYQYLAAGPGTTPWIVGGVVGGLGAGAVFAGAVATGTLLLALAAPVAALIAGGVAAFSAGPLEPWKNLRALPVSIVPWGLLLDSDRVATPVPWKDVRSIRYSLVKHDRREDGDARKMAIVLFEIGDQRIQASGEEGEWLASVCELYKKLALAAESPPSGDIAGAAPLDAAGLPVSLALIRRATAILDSADGRASLGLASGGYRTSGSRIAGPETREVLLRALRDGQTRFDAGPLACVLAAELGIDSLVGEILNLILSPSPLLSAAARASAVRLGASLMSAGSLAELRHFAHSSDLHELKAWMERADGQPGVRQPKDLRRV